jgi:biopolymer transport protein TolQ
MGKEAMGGVDLLYMIKQSGLIIAVDLVVLMLMSLGSWSVVFYKTVELTRAKRNTATNLRAVEEASDLKSAMAALESYANSPSHRVATEGLSELKRLRGIHPLSTDRLPFVLDSTRQALREEIRVQVDRLSGSLPFLATCTTTAPLLGLFGTVWGIMDSFHSFKGLTTSSLAVVGPGLAEALTTTALGLLVAIPAGLAHNFLLQRLGTIESDLTKFANVLVQRIEMGLKSPGKETPSS